MIEDKLKEELQNIADEIIVNYYNKGLKASGRLGESIKVEVEKDGYKYKGYIKGNSYIEQLEIGRRPTSPENKGRLYNVIKKWINEKGITPTGNISKSSLAFLIARKIDNEGIKVPNRYNSGGVVSDVITKDRLIEVVKKINTNFVIEIRSDIYKLWQ